MSAYRALKVRHRRFLDEYLLGKTGADAVRAIGYHGERADAAAYKILARDDVRAALAERRASLFDAVGLRQEQIVRELMRVGFSDVRRLFDTDGRLKNIPDLDDEAAACLASVENEELFEIGMEDGKRVRERVGTLRKVKVWDKVKALGELAEIAGLKKVDATPPNAGPGMTIVVQQGMQVNGPAAAAQHVVVNLPGPAK